MLTRLVLIALLHPAFAIGFGGQGPAFATGFGGQGLTRPTAQDLAWLAGCWEFTRGTRHVTEQWMRPEGGAMLGMSRTVSDGKMVEYEFLMIRQGEAGLEYVARPSGQAEAVFTATRTAPREIVFENPKHDFPTRISYRGAADGTLRASVEGDMKGQKQVLDFPYRRATCGR